jgi:uncharacterized protein YecT (DUF1311 family)
MDPHEMMRALLALAVLAGMPASAAAFDCKKAATPSEKAICADPAALAADAAMGAAFQALLRSSPASQRPQIAGAQARWLPTRDGDCADSKGPELGACLARESDRRRAFLAGQPEAGPGAPGKIAPWFRYEKGGKGRSEVDLELLKFVDPKSVAERTFNAAVEKLTSDIVQPEKDEPNPDSFAYDWSMRLTYASPRFVSAHLTGYVSSGGAHPNSSTANVNVDFSLGREARFEDLFAVDEAAKIFQFCVKSVREQKKERLGDDAPKSADDLKSLTHDVQEATRNLSAWSFGADKATIDYDPYAVGSYAEGPYVCEIPYATLRGLAKPGFPLP